MASFPAYAASAVVASSFRRTRAPGVLRSDFESGARQQVKVAERVLVTESLQIQLSNSDYGAFKRWLEDDAGRVDWFSYTPPGESSAVQARVVNGAIKSESPLDAALSHWLVAIDVEYWSPRPAASTTTTTSS